MKRFTTSGSAFQCPGGHAVSFDCSAGEGEYITAATISNVVVTRYGTPANNSNVSLFGDSSPACLKIVNGDAVSYGTGMPMMDFGLSFYASFQDASSVTIKYGKQTAEMMNNWYVTSSANPYETYTAYGETVIFKGSDLGVSLSVYLAIRDGKIFAKITVIPTSVSVTAGGSALPTGSVLKNTTTGQKFLKIAGNEKAYSAIPITPKSEWNWSQAATDAWAVLQSY